MRRRWLNLSRDSSRSPGIVSAPTKPGVARGRDCKAAREAGAFHSRRSRVNAPGNGGECCGRSRLTRRIARRGRDCLLASAISKYFGFFRLNRGRGVVFIVSRAWQRAQSVIFLGFLVVALVCEWPRSGFRRETFFAGGTGNSVVIAGVVAADVWLRIASLF